VESESVQPLPSDDPAKPLLYKTVIERREIPQNSIVSFKGRVEVIREKEGNPDGFNVFQSHSEFTYEVVNQSNLSVETEFLFPFLDIGNTHSNTTHSVYENIHIEVDGQEFDDFIVVPAGLQWTMEMSPQEKAVVFISFDAKGMDGYTYGLADKREVTNFELDIFSNTSDVFFSVYPEGGNIDFKAIMLQRNAIIATVNIDRVISAPSMGLSFVQNTFPYAPHDATLRLLRFMPRGLVFLLVIFTLTLLIAEVRVNYRELLLLQALSWGYVLLFMAFSPYPDNARKILFLGSIGLGTFFFFLLWGKPSLPRIGILAWTILLLGFYPLNSGKNYDAYPKNLYDTFILTCILVYIFAYLLYMRLNKGKTSRPF
jgi:hypothetical protein